MELTGKFILWNWAVPAHSGKRERVRIGWSKNGYDDSIERVLNEDYYYYYHYHHHTIKKISN
jgi:hypothetical protein